MSLAKPKRRIKRLRLSAPTSYDVERLAMTLCWEESDARDYLRNRARFILEALAKVSP